MQAFLHNLPSVGTAREIWRALLLLAEYGDRPDYRKLAEESIADVLESAVRYPTAFARWLSAADFALGPVRQVALVGSPQKPAMQGFLSTLWKQYRPRLVAAISPYPPAPGSPALLDERPLLNGLPTAYVCEGFVCQLPLTDPAAFSHQIDSVT